MNKTEDYKEGDIVWVKLLGLCWWPGELVSFEKLPEDITESFKKPPLAVVKFFKEDNYEFVKNLNQICPYDCDRKNDFIKKGLDFTRAEKNEFMEKFPPDIITAEVRTGGNTKILDDPCFEPEKKPKIPKESPVRTKSKQLSSKNQSTPGSVKKYPVLVTHPRFLGDNDHKVRILLQKNEEPSIPLKEYKCPFCAFKSVTMNTLTFHSKLHIQGVYTTKKSEKRRTPFKTKSTPQIPQTKTSSIDEDIALLSQGHSICSDTEDSPVKIKRKQVSLPPTIAKKPKVTVVAELASEWDADDYLLDETCTNEVSETSKIDETPDLSKESESLKEVQQHVRSCFDFVDDDDSDIITVSEGRKIPRVIPHLDKRKSIEMRQDFIELSDRSTRKFSEINEDFDFAAPDSFNSTIADVPETHSEKKTKSDLEKGVENEDVNVKLPDVKSQREDFLFDTDIDSFKDVLESTALPKMPEIPQILKYEQNFHKAKTIKFPDKEDDTEKTMDLTSNVEENTFQESSKDTFQDSLKDVFQDSSKDDTFQDSSKDDIFQDSSKDDTFQDSSKDDTFQDSSKHDTFQNSSKHDTFQDSSKDMFQDSLKDDTFQDSSKNTFQDTSKDDTFQDSLKDDIFQDSSKDSFQDSSKVTLTDNFQTEDDCDKHLPDASNSSQPLHNFDILPDVTSKIEIFQEFDRQTDVSENTQNVLQDSDKPTDSLDCLQKRNPDSNKVTEVATKLTNPKKRFAKTFEDETKNLTNKEEKVIEDKSGQQLEEATVEVSKLKTQLMSKLNIRESSPKRQKTEHPLKYKKFRFHKENVSKGSSDRFITDRIRTTRRLRTKLSDDFKINTACSEADEDDAEANSFVKSSESVTPPVDMNTHTDHTVTGSIEVDIKTNLDLQIKLEDTEPKLGSLETQQPEIEMVSDPIIKADDAIVVSERENTKLVVEDRQVKPYDSAKIEVLNPEVNTGDCSELKTNEHPETQYLLNEVRNVILGESETLADTLATPEIKMATNDTKDNEMTESLLNLTDSEKIEVSKHLDEEVTADGITPKEMSEYTKVTALTENIESQDINLVPKETKTHKTETEFHSDIIPVKAVSPMNRLDGICDSESTVEVTEEIHVSTETISDTIVVPVEDTDKNTYRSIHENSSFGNIEQIENKIIQDELEYNKEVERSTQMQINDIKENSFTIENDEQANELKEHNLNEIEMLTSQSTEENISLVKKQCLHDIDENFSNEESKVNELLVEESALDDNMLEEKLNKNDVALEESSNKNEIEVEPSYEDAQSYIEKRSDENESIVVTKCLEFASENVVLYENLSDEISCSTIEKSEKGIPNEDKITVNEKSTKEALSHNHFVTAIEESYQTESKRQEDTKPVEKCQNEKSVDIGLTSSGHSSEIISNDSDMVEIEGNLTVVNENDLADKQVEIATNDASVKIESKPVTMMSFSMDFCEDNLEADIIGRKTGKQNSKPEKQNNSTLEKIEAESEGLGIKSYGFIGKSRKADQASREVKDIEEDINYFEINKSEQFDCENVSNIEPEQTEKYIDFSMETASKNVTVVPSESATLPQVDMIKPEAFPMIDASVESEVAKITDFNEKDPVMHHKEESTTSSKLLEILTDVKPKSTKHKSSGPTFQTKKLDSTSKEKFISKSEKHIDVPVTKDKTRSGRYVSKNSKFIIKPASTITSTSKINKPIILSEKIITPVIESTEATVSVKKIQSKRTFEDFEDMDAFIIERKVKKMSVPAEPEEEKPSTETKSLQKNPAALKGKARILQQTIITPSGDIIQPAVSSQSQGDDNMFDINSMPIVLGDQILTPESIENMLQESSPSDVKPPVTTQVSKMPIQQTHSKLLNKCAPAILKDSPLKHQTGLVKQYAGKQGKIQKVYQTTSPKIVKSNPAIITQTGKHGKYIIVPSSSTPTGTKYTVGKRTPIIKRSSSTVPIGTKVQNITPDSTGNKVMIIKNSEGQQRVLLTSAHHKMLTSQAPGTRIKLGSKTNILHKPMASQELITSKGTNILSHAIVNSKSQVSSSPNQCLVSSPIATKNIKIDPKTKKPVVQNQKVYLQGGVTPGKSGTNVGHQRTIIIKNPQGQTVKRLHGSDDALLEQQVAEQLQAINRASAKTHLKDLALKTKPIKKSYIKKPALTEQVKLNTITKLQSAHSTPAASSPSLSKASSLPPLAPISPTKKSETMFTQSIGASSEKTENVVKPIEDAREEPKRPPHHLVIQDAHGNQTTITEGQILALPSEAIDGHPHSYVLVTLDETGNLAPLNSEALMSLDPNLTLGGDIGNMVLQIDQGITSEAEKTPTVPLVDSQEVVAPKEIGDPMTKPPEPEKLVETKSILPVENNPTAVVQQNVDANTMQAVAINSGDTGQQLIITGDPISTQKFLESLTEGNADLANLLANAEGNILIQAEGQQILINTDSDNQMLLTVNPDNLNSNENTEGSGNPIFASQPVKNQDILAAALADTDVFQQEQSISNSPSKVIHSQLSPNSALYPIHVGNVLETSTMNSPIMTPIELPSTNNKKIGDEVDILSQVPKNVDLPITITDPNISQTVAQQQVASLMATELPTTLELPLAIQDPNMSVTSSDINSPSFVYSLPNLDDNDINQKGFSTSISMPLLTEEPEDTLVDTPPIDSANVLVSSTVESNVESATPPTIDDSSGHCLPVETKEPTEEKSRNVDADARNTDKSKEDRGTDTDGTSSELSVKNVKKTKTELKETFIDTGLCTMRGGICNSLSEPPPDMFDFSLENQNFEGSNEVKESAHADIAMDASLERTNASPQSDTTHNEQDSTDVDKTSTDDSLKTDDTKSMDMTLFNVGTVSELTSPSTNTDDSCEIPVQPEIVTDLTSKTFDNDVTNDSSFDTNVRNYVGEEKV